jgi:hypothetical protein
MQMAKIGDNSGDTVYKDKDFYVRNVQKMAQMRL